MPPARLVACLWLVGVTQSQVSHRADPPTPHPSLTDDAPPPFTRATELAVARLLRNQTVDWSRVDGRARARGRGRRAALDRVLGGSVTAGVQCSPPYPAALENRTCA